MWLSLKKSIRGHQGSSANPGFACGNHLQVHVPRMQQPLLSLAFSACRDKKLRILNVVACYPRHEQVRGPCHLAVPCGSVWVHSDSRWVLGEVNDTAFLRVTECQGKLENNPTQRNAQGRCKPLAALWCCLLAGELRTPAAVHLGSWGTPGLVRS